MGGIPQLPLPALSAIFTGATAFPAGGVSTGTPSVVPHRRAECSGASSSAIDLMRRLRPLPLLVTACLLAPPAVSAQEQPVDRRSRQQIADSAEVAALSRKLVKGLRTDSARAAAIYEWVARNVRYDAQSFFRGGDGYEKAEEVYRHRMALCGGYVALYERIAREAGMRAVPITGYAKGVDYRFGRSTRKPNHAWLAMSIGGEWRLIDPTWGAGVINGRAFEPSFSWDYFLVSPEELILSHYPEDAAWQLLDRPLARRDFERMQLVPRTLLRVGFEPEVIRATALTPGVRDFPAVGAAGSGVRVLHAPVAGTLPASTPVTIDVVWPGAAEVVLVSNGVWTKLNRVGDRFRGAGVAAGTSVYVVGRTAGASQPYQTLLHYRVAGGGRASSK